MAVNINITKKELHASLEKFYLTILEGYCYKLRDAMIDLSLKLPEINTIDRYFKELKDYDNIVYILSILHKCWCFAHPEYLFNTIPKDLSIDEMFQRLSIYQLDSSRGESDMLKEELDKKHNPLLIAYYNAFRYAGDMALCYGEYMKQLHNVIYVHCNEFYIDIKDNFTIIPTLKTDKTTQQLKDVFNVFSRDFDCCDDSDENLRVFLSMFNTTISVPEGTIPWHDMGSEKNRQFSIASIYTIFKTLGIEMNRHNREVICKFITRPDGKSLKQEQIKSRTTEKQDRLKEALEAVL